MALLEAANQLQEEIEGQIGMQAANDVKFRGAFAHALIGTFIHFFERESVCARGSGIAAKGAELAMRHADIGGIDVAIDVVIGDVAVALFANEIGQPAHGQQIGRAIERHAIVEGEAFARQHLIGDGLQAFVSERQFSHDVLCLVDATPEAAATSNLHFKNCEKFKPAKAPRQRPRTTGTTY